MPEDIKVDSTTQQDGTAPEIDFNKELQEEIERTERAERNRQGYELRKAKKTDETTNETEEDSEEKLAQRLLAKILPSIEASTTHITLETQLNQMTSDPNLQKLIKHHFDNSVSSVGTVQERLENARAIALKKLINKQASELNIASSNRAQISNMSMGTHSEPIAQIPQNKLSELQINSLKARGFTDQMIEKAIKNMANGTYGMPMK